MKERKKLSDKQKQERKAKAKAIILKILHAIGYLSLVAWALLGLLYACGSKKVQGASAEGEEEYNSAYILTSREQADIFKQYYNVGGSRLTVNSRYKLYMPLETYTVVNQHRMYTHMARADFYYQELTTNLTYNSSGVIGSNGWSEIVIYAKDFDTSDYENINSPYIVVEYAQDEIYLSVEDINGNLHQVMNIVPNYPTYPYPIILGSDFTNEYYNFFIEFFSGRYSLYYPIHSPTDEVIAQQKTIAFLFTNYSVHNLLMSPSSFIDYDYLQHFTDLSDGLVKVTQNVYKANYQNLWGRNIDTNTVAFDVLQGDFYIENDYYDTLTVKAYTFEGQYLNIMKEPKEATNISISETSPIYVIKDNVDYVYYMPQYLSLYNSSTHTYFDISQYGWLLTGMTTLAYVFYDKPNILYGYNAVTVKGIHDYYGYSWQYNPTTSYVNYNNVTYLGNNVVWANSFNFQINGNGDVIVGGIGDIQDFYGNYTNIFTLINLAYTGLLGLMGYYILPGISIGTLIFLPFVLTLLLFVIKLFKR